jgi:hypothetical protein
MSIRQALPRTLAVSFACAMLTLNIAHAASAKHGRPLPHRHAVASAPQSSWAPWGSWGSWSSGSSDSSSSSSIDDDIRRNDEMNRQMQQDSDAMNAAIQQSNEMNAAAQAQIQLQNDLANLPPPQPN